MNDHDEVRIPPHDLDAEAAVLSAVMLDCDEGHAGALDSVVDLLKPEHMYSEAHRWIYEAAVTLHAAGQPVDVVQIATWLKDRDRIAQVGGMGYLTEVLNAAPAVSNVRAYAKTIVAKAKARAVIRTCQHHAAVGYLDYGSADEYAARAADQLHAIAVQGRVEQVAPILDVVQARVASVVAANKSGRAILGVSTGFTRYDRLTAGLHDGDLTIVAARPGMGKTSFVLDITANVARGNAGEHVLPEGVIFYSLEMPREQLVDRLLCAHAGIDLGRMRRATLTPLEWDRYTRSALEIGKLPIWIDDTAAPTMLDIRARVRRTNAELARRPRVDPQGRPVVSDDGTPQRMRVGLVVVDYLQLVKGNRQAGSREQEVSEISRALKGLAKEMKLPVIALSQLNRSVETRAEKNKRPQLSDLRECVTGEMRVLDVMTGEMIAVKDLANGKTAIVAGLDADQRVVGAPLTAAWSTGKKPVLLIRMKTGRVLRVTANHPVCTPEGYVEAAALKAGASVASARRLPQPNAPRNLPIDEARLLGYLLADGSYRCKGNCLYVRADAEASLEILRIARARFNMTGRAVKENGFTVTLAGSPIRTHENPVLAWLKLLGVEQAPSSRVPQELFRSDNATVEAFFRALLSAEGTFVLEDSTKHGVTLQSSSAGVLSDVQALLLRFGKGSTLEHDDDIHRLRVPYMPPWGKIAKPTPPSANGADIEWDVIESIAPDGEAEVFDLRVAATGNFLIEGLCVHNSGAIEQDADNICFLYREDYYDRATENRNIAELILAKQRNGPTDTVKVRFDREYARFRNLPEEEEEDNGHWATGD